MMHRLIFLDFETYYDAECSAKVLIPPLYVKHPKFKVVMVGVSTEVGGVTIHRASDVRDALLALKLDEEGTVTVCHNAAFDGCILEYHYGIHPWRYACTMAMAQASGLALMAGGGSLDALGKYVHKAFGLLPLKGKEVHSMMGISPEDMDEGAWASYGRYCADDVKVTRNVYKVALPSVTKGDMRLISETVMMTTRPIFEFDKDVLAAYSKQVEDELDATLTALRRVTGQRTNEAVAKYIGSDDKFATLLRSYGAEPPRKISKAKVTKISTQGSLDGFDSTDSIMAYAFSKSDQAFLDMVSDHPLAVVRDLCEARLEVKSGLLRTRAKRLLTLAEYGIAPIPIRFAAAHTGRGGGDMKINMQNLPRGPLRRSLRAKEGWVVLSADSSQIEARINAYISDQQDMLDIFRNGEDLYCHMGAALGGMTYEEVFQIAKVAPTEHGSFLRKLGKVTELACGYQMGASKFGDGLAVQGIELPAGMTPESVVKLYRATKDKISAAWAFNSSHVLEMLYAGDAFTFGGPDGKLFKANGSDELFGQRCPTIQLPDGFKLKYYKLAREIEPGTRFVKFTYIGREDASGGFATKKIYGGLLQENCIAEGTLVLTDIGWKPIETVCADDLVHDGDGWVSHGGLVARSEQQCVTVDGVYMTEDHRVLDETENWVCASQQPRPYRPDLRGVTLPWSGVYDGEEMEVGLPMRLWEFMRKRRRGGTEGGTERTNPKLWVLNQRDTACPAHEARYGRPPSVRGMAVDESTMHQPNAQGVGQLWGSGYNGLCRVAKVFRKFLGGYERGVRRGVRLGQNQQRAGVLERKLPLGDSQNKLLKQAQQFRHGHSIIEPTNRDTKINIDVQITPGARRFRVYDLINCGPKTRFVVKGDTGPMLVHNCCQALAFAVIKYQGLKAIEISKGVVRLGLNVHDEWVTASKDEDLEVVVPALFQAMTSVPPWLEGCPLDCEVDVGLNYQDMETL